MVTDQGKMMQFLTFLYFFENFYTFSGKCLYFWVKSIVAELCIYILEWCFSVAAMIITRGPGL